MTSPGNLFPIDPLTRYAIRHGSDKFGGHLYTPIYNALFGHLRESKIKFLEIGVGGYHTPKAGGASLRMWAEYFPCAEIIGLDIEPKELDISPRVTIIQGSQIDFGLLDKISESHGPFDVIIDDGSHIVSNVKDTFFHLYPLMTLSGIYVVEDTQTSFIPELGGDPSGPGTIFDLAHRISLAMHSKEGFNSTPGGKIEQFGSITRSVSIYRNQAVFHRGNNTYPSNHNLSLENPEVSLVYSTILKEANLNPSPRSTVSIIDMAIRANRCEEAAQLALDASEKYSSDATLHYELIRMMEWATHSASLEILHQRLMEIKQ